MEKTTINGTEYGFTSDFKDDHALRKGFNSLAKSTFDFDFEDYYRSGYWNDRYIPYALMDGKKVVANVSANILDFFVCGDQKRYIQIGTVMTDKAYRGRGLCRYLLDLVIGRYLEQSHMIYLFANDTVLDLYPKFGFVKNREYQYEKPISCSQTESTVLPLNMDQQADRDLLFRLSDSTHPFSRLTALRNTGLVMFYATSFMKDSFYYIDSLDAAVFAEYQDGTLYLNDIFSSRDISVGSVISAMSKPDTDRVVLGFTPVDTDGYLCNDYLHEDETLFVLSKNTSIFDQHKLMLPILSHA